MKKRVFTLLLALCLLMTTSGMAVNHGTNYFTRVKTYAGQFSDVTEESTFYDNVSALYEYGLSVGKLDGTYGLTDSLTVGQAVIFGGRIRSLYRTGDAEAGAAAYRVKGQLAAEPYLRYLQAEGVLDEALDEQLTAAATRAQMAHILANILPEEILPSIHDALVTEAYATRSAISDVNEYTPYFRDILALYRKGVCIGSDASGSFFPDALITRGAAAAMLTRMVEPALRVTPQWKLNDHFSAKGTTLAQLVTPGVYIADPSTEKQMDESVRYMLAAGNNQLTLSYPGVTMVKARRIMEMALASVKRYCEQSYNSVSCGFTSQGNVVLEFTAANIDKERIGTYRTATLEAAIWVHDQLWERGWLTESMTEREKALVYYTWVCENCVYDQEASDNSLSHIAYSLFALGTAVCDGYTGAYNLLLKLEGIDCYALSNNGHIWTVAMLDGADCHIDTTWGDSEEEIDYAFFAMTPEQSWAYHPW